MKRNINKNKNKNKNKHVYEYKNEYVCGAKIKKKKKKVCGIYQELRGFWTKIWTCANTLMIMMVIRNEI